MYACLTDGQTGQIHNTSSSPEDEQQRHKIIFKNYFTLHQYWTFAGTLKYIIQLVVTSALLQLMLVLLLLSYI